MSKFHKIEEKVVLYFGGPLVIGGVLLFIWNEGWASWARWLDKVIPMMLGLGAIVGVLLLLVILWERYAEEKEQKEYLWKAFTESNEIIREQRAKCGKMWDEQGVEND